MAGGSGQAGRALAGHIFKLIIFNNSALDSSIAIMMASGRYGGSLVEPAAQEQSCQTTNHGNDGFPSQGLHVVSSVLQ